ncbi:MAG TPA: BadF/BadG/BcrA/BcrD ATPase family protein, partial [Jatrophihabitans sp.]|nr:BadF/BadG/BcrA/BcrD ATPase family protein [Jatrophihabitans sp.]
MTTGRYAVDAGGSGTAVRAFGGGWQLPSINPCSDGAAAADAALADLLGSIAADVRGRQLAGARVWLAAASAGHDRPETERARLAAAVRDVPVPLAITLCNDVDALVLACLAEAGTVVAVCGTGSGVVAASPAAGVVRVGGEEYLAGDQGSAYDLGRAALRAAARALDGRGPATALTGELAGAGGCPVPELGRRLAGLPHAKRAVAA